MQRLEVSGAVRPLHGSLGVKGLNNFSKVFQFVMPDHTSQYCNNKLDPSQYGFSKASLQELHL